MTESLLLDLGPTHRHPSFEGDGTSLPTIGVDGEVFPQVQGM